MDRVQLSIRMTVLLWVLSCAWLGLVLVTGSSALASLPLSWSAPTLIAHQQPWNSSHPKGVSCPSIGLCVAVDAVGNVVTSTDPKGAASAWTVANVDGTRTLRGVSCPSIDLCVAIDERGNVVTSTDPAGGASAWAVSNIDGINSFEGVACPSAGLCVAVDDQGNIATSTDPAGGAIAWTVIHVDSDEFGFSRGGVSCPSVSSCIALDRQGDVVSSTSPTGGSGAWTLTKALNHLYEGVDTFRGVSCSSAALCVAIAGNGTLLATSVNPTGGEGAWTAGSVEGASRITSVTCSSIGLCIGGDQAGHVVTSSNPAGGAATWTSTAVDGTNSLEGMSCPSAGLCAAVDNQGDVITSTHPSAGATSWTAVSVDGTSPLAAVSCPSAGLCIAVQTAGGIVTSTSPADGAAAWAVTGLPGFDPLRDVSCPSANLCVAGGGGGTIATSTNPTGGASAWNAIHVSEIETFNHVSCASEALCVAVDENGNAVTSTNPTGGAGAWTTSFIDALESGDQGLGGGRYHDLSGLSCPSNNLCVASDREGNFLTSTNPTGGTDAWLVTRAKNTVPPISVSCPSVGLCVGVNYSGDILTTTHPAGGAEAWTVTPHVDTQSNTLSHVSCASITFCVATDVQGNVVASTDPTGGVSAWTIANVEVTNAEGVQWLEGVSCPSTGLCVIIDREGHAIIGTESTLPANISLPTISGTTVVGQTLDCSPGSWSGSTPQIHSYQWLRDGANITGATSSTYIVQAADQGHAVTCRVTDANVAGQASAASAPRYVPAASDGTNHNANGESEAPSLNSRIAMRPTDPGNTAVIGSITSHFDSVLVSLRCALTIGICAPVTLEMVVVEHVFHGHVVAVTAHHATGIKQRAVVIGRATIMLGAGHRRTVKLSLNSAGSALTAQHQKVTALLVIISQHKTLRSRILTLTRPVHRVDPATAAHRPAR